MVPFGKVTGETESGVGKCKSVLERIVIAEARRAAAIFKCAVINSVAAAHNEFWSDLIGKAEARREIVFLDHTEPGAVGIGVNELMPSLASRLVKLGRERRILFPCSQE